jgi:hypothetical protein
MSKVSQMRIKQRDKSTLAVVGWDEAIAEGERQIRAAEARIKELRLAISGFEEMREHGELFPVEIGLLGQATDL